jgi:hypothetical protein
MTEKDAVWKVSSEIASSVRQLIFRDERLPDQAGRHILHGNPLNIQIAIGEDGVKGAHCVW